MTETAAAPGAEDTTPPPACQNCGTPLLGPHCYKCGQPVNGLVRHFSSIMGDFADSVLNIDARVFRTLWPLLARPGYLTREYFAGHRVRYVSPVRLFVFLSIATFFIAQLMVSWDSPPVQYGNGTPATTAPATAGADAAPDAEVLPVLAGEIDPGALDAALERPGHAVVAVQQVNPETGTLVLPAQGKRDPGDDGAGHGGCGRGARCRRASRRGRG